MCIITSNQCVPNIKRVLACFLNYVEIEYCSPAPGLNVRKILGVRKKNNADSLEIYG